MIVTEADKNRTVNCIKGISREEYEINGKRVEYIIDCKKRKATQAYFAGDIKSGNITIRFSDIVNDDQMQFPRRIEINDDLSSLTILFEIKKIERPWNGKIGFVPGQGYKVIILK
jgi:prophage tail gpP-like protein